MEDNEMLEEVIDETIEETQEEVNEVEETTDGDSSDDTPTVEDYERIRKENETLKAQKEHWRKKAEVIKNSDTKINKTETTDDERLLKLAKFANNLDDDDFGVLKTINGSSIEEKLENPLFKAYKAEKERKKRSNEASLRPSTPGRMFAKNDPNDTGISQEERDERIKKIMGL